jgi:photosystem II stability/assembly factor-like uncharacterized protein
MEIDRDFDWTPQRGRARRAIVLIAASLLSITAAGTAFLQPSLPSFMSGSSTKAPLMHAAYRVAAVDFVDRSTGWVVALLKSGDYAIMHTTDGGLTWTRQLSAPSDGRAHYVKFFNHSVGIFALLGTRPLLHRTADGGRTWSQLLAVDTPGNVVSWSFVDSDHGWMLVTDPGRAAPSRMRLYRTVDGGRLWTDLGPPVDAPDQAFQIHFSYLTTGWLTSAGSGAYAYKTNDFGATWSRVALPAPPGGWPRSGQFFVAVQPTSGAGAVASVVYFPPIKGRTGIGGTVRAFPPLTVRGFDGGRPRTFLYATVIDQVAGGPYTQDQAPNQSQLSTVDNGVTWAVIGPPAPTGAIGYFNASNWWWIGAGLWSSSNDGGVTWTGPRGTGVVEPVPGSLQVLDRDHAWFAGSTPSKPVLQSTDDGALHWRTVVLPAIEVPPTP